MTFARTTDVIVAASVEMTNSRRSFWLGSGRNQASHSIAVNSPPLTRA